MLAAEENEQEMRGGLTITGSVAVTGPLLKTGDGMQEKSCILGKHGADHVRKPHFTDRLATVTDRLASDFVSGIVANSVHDLPRHNELPSGDPACSECCGPAG